MENQINGQLKGTQNAINNVASTNSSVKYGDYLTQSIFTWCTNCGNYGIWGAMRDALVRNQIAPKDVLFIHDIGCNGNGADKINGYGFKGLHGRAIPLGAGAALANSRVKVIASSGDGGVLAEGIGHLIHAVRSNYNMTFIIHNNSNFALTTGQASPATSADIPMNSAPDGITADTMNILGFILPLKPSFVARGFTGDQKQLSRILQAAISHKGFSVVEVMQYCPSYNHLQTNDWYNERVFDVNADSSYDVGNFGKALEAVQDLETHIATGVIYVNPAAKDFINRQKNRIDFLKEKFGKDIKSELVDEVKSFDVVDLLEGFK
jgi:2-oxoglutarate ferredoxin oxidoreductase subunit beta